MRTLNHSLTSYRPKFLCNTSGSGKTRLLLEGLSRHWGFYFTARNEPEGVGSKDLELVLQGLTPRLNEIIDGGPATALDENRNVVRHRFRLLLYARYVCLRVFLECAAAMEGGITENHKGRWLLIQLAPITLLGSDIFFNLIQSVGRASSDSLLGFIHHETMTIERLLQQQPQQPTLFCVLDEAQTLTKDLKYFQSETGPVTPRPILSPIVHEWGLIIPNLIVSGTGMSMREVETVMGSVGAKESGGPETVTQIGGFDDEDGRRAYLERYFPLEFLGTSEGKLLAYRVGYWLRGRFVFNAAV